ncbi:hypothetical protein GCM10007063_17590 [Lentibacillus kapialis]|uniref:Branched-chain amino acid ABC transporter substrate-binding protein n=2 Tax=Lentibacillus kapialis TaxID=340214 RepID=A0A917PVY4_9BACI|nr:hypothetical protein GCM10007063_17590 [Lentibacillus kapialis]
MKKITDERLKLKNLKNIRVLFLFQNIGIISILGYDLVTKGMDGMTANPLWYVFLITGVVSAYLSMSISIDHESSNKSPKKGLIILTIIGAFIAIGFGVLVFFTGGVSTVATSILVGGIVFVCFLAPSLYIYYLRTKRQD